jgi:class 3 adenylate cyclase/pimeloyl-ACP methyl ester carboxylesterase
MSIEPQIRYAKTADGVNIAWAEAGHGPAMLFCTQFPFCHVQEQFAIYGDAFEAFSRSFRFITFDARGTGMSQRDVPLVSSDTLMLDAEAVLDAANVEHVVVNADGSSMLATLTCVRLAIAFPDRVTHVILESPVESTKLLADSPFGRTNLALAELDWTVYTQALFRILLGLSSPAMAESSAASAARWVDPVMGVQYIRELEAVDLSALLPQVRQPTLVTRNEPFFVPARYSQDVAAKIPGAQFRPYSDPTYAQMADIISAFIGQPAPLAHPEPRSNSPLRTILFTDIVGHTEMMQRLGDAKGRDVLREHERITRDLLKQHGGAEVKTMGDGFMASFNSVTQALDCAIALQRAFAARTDDAPTRTRTDRSSDLSPSVPEPIAIRVGLNAGEPIEEDGDLFGATVILASRIAAKAGAGEILVPDTVRGLLSGKNFLFGDRGEFIPKGFDDAVRLYEVRWRPEGSPAAESPQEADGE